MTQLLVSVKNVPEALLALRAGADVIDMKDPSVSALGALDTKTITAILQAMKLHDLQNRVTTNLTTSATIGENFPDLTTMRDTIIQTADLGVNIVKLPLNGHDHDLKALFGILKALSMQNITLFGVLFADVEVNLDLVESAAEAGFTGVMLDTQSKTQDLLCHTNHATLLNFVNRCKGYGLKSGLAGSLQVQYIENLVAINPSYMGFRGGLCNHLNRNSDLDLNKLEMAKLLLHKGDNKVKIPYENSSTTLNC